MRDKMESSNGVLFPARSNELRFDKQIKGCDQLSCMYAKMPKSKSKTTDVLFSELNMHALKHFTGFISADAFILQQNKHQKYQK